VLQTLGVATLDKEMKSYATHTQVLPPEVCFKVEDEMMRRVLEEVASSVPQTTPATGHLLPEKTTPMTAIPVATNKNVSKGAVGKETSSAEAVLHPEVEQVEQGAVGKETSSAEAVLHPEVEQVEQGAVGKETSSVLHPEVEQVVSTDSDPKSAPDAGPVFDEIKQHMVDALSLIDNNSPLEELMASFEQFLPALEANKWQVTPDVAEDVKKVWGGFEKSKFLKNIMKNVEGTLLDITKVCKQMDNKALEDALKDPNLTDDLRSALRGTTVDNAVAELVRRLPRNDLNRGEAHDIFHVTSKILKSGALGQVDYAVNAINNVCFFLKLGRLDFQLDHIIVDDAGLSDGNLQWIAGLDPDTLTIAVERLDSETDKALKAKESEADAGPLKFSLRGCILAFKRLVQEGTNLSAVGNSLIEIIDKFSYLQTSAAKIAKETPVPMKEGTEPRKKQVVKTVKELQDSLTAKMPEKGSLQLLNFLFRGFENRDYESLTSTALEKAYMGCDEYSKIKGLEIDVKGWKAAYPFVDDPFVDDFLRQQDGLEFITVCVSELREARFQLLKKGLKDQATVAPVLQRLLDEHNAAVALLKFKENIHPSLVIKDAIVNVRGSLELLKKHLW